MIQRLRPEDRTKAVGLLGLSVAVFAIAGFRAQTVSPQIDGETSVTMVLEKQDKTNANSNLSTNKVQSDDDPIVVTARKPQARINPFKDPISSVALPVKTSSMATQAAFQNSVTPAIQAETGQNVVASDNPAVQEQNPIESLNLSVAGVVSGEKSLAIVQSNKGQFIVCVGDTFGHGCKVVSISSTTVAIAYRQKVEYFPVSH